MEMEQILSTGEQDFSPVNEDSDNDSISRQNPYQVESQHVPVQEQVVLDYVSELPDEILSAAGEGDVVAIARWLDSGGNVNGRGERRRISSWEVRHCGITVIMEASLYGNGDLVSMLLDRGAAIHLHDSKGNTALHMAACNGTRNEAGNASIVDMLLQNGASDHCNFRGETALKLARDDHCYNIERVILKAHGLSWIPPYVFTAAGSAHRLTRGTALTGSSILLSI